MRAPGRFPDYPVTSQIARRRIGELARRIGRIDVRLAREKLAPGARDALWGERDGWKEELDALREAFETMDALPLLPRCACGKIAHLNRENAERHARSVRTVSDERGKRAIPVSVYACPRRTPHAGVAWHVGHDVKLLTTERAPDKLSGNGGNRK